jgi:hypothetical protein
MEVQADYSRYVGDGFTVRDSFTVETSTAVRALMMRRARH